MRRTLVAVTLASSLATFSPSRFLQPLWTLVSSLWGQPAQEGCGMDPNGRCLPAPQPTSDIGCGMDPDGRCNPGS